MRTREDAVRAAAALLLLLLLGWAAAPCGVRAETLADLASPCPGLFEYERTSPEPNRWYGTVQLITDTKLSGVWLRLIFDQEVSQLGNWFGSVETKDQKEFVVKNPSHVLAPGTQTPVRFFVQYTAGGRIPRLSAYRINGKTACRQVGPVPTPRPTAATTTQRAPGLPWVTSGTGTGGDDDEDFFDPSDPAFPIPGRPSSAGAADEAVCGRVVARPRPLVFNGQATFQGQFPWHAALFHTQNRRLEYVCGGALVSARHVLTVAHCATRKQSATPLRPDRMAVYLGKFYLTRWNTAGLQEFRVQRIAVHARYDPTTFSDDIAVLLLDKRAEYTDWVRPVCLWRGDVLLEAIVGQVGTVTGWGVDASGNVTEELMSAQMPVVSEAVCLRSYPEFFARFTSNMTFCAGFLNGVTVCNGDSGGALLLPRATTSTGTVWQLRGLVSVSVAQQGVRCDTTYYTVFTDAAKYLPWIRQTLGQLT